VSFINSALLGLAGLFTVPLIIHLLNKRRFRTLPWAAMDFLLNAYKQNRRRMQLESLLLLVLRCLIPILLALAVARPRLTSASDLPLAAQGKHHILLLDRSYSMGYRETNGTRPFDRAKQIAIKVLEHAAKNPNDKVSLVMFDSHVATLVQAEPTVQRALTALEKATDPRDGISNLGDGLREAMRLANSEELPDRIYVCSDFQQLSLTSGAGVEADAGARPAGAPNQPANHKPEGGAQAGSKRTTLEEIKDLAADLEDMGAELVLLPVAPVETTSNTLVTSMHLDPENVVARVPSIVRATVLHRGPSTRTLVATLTVGGKNPQAKRLVLEPGKPAELQFPLRFLEEGMHQVELALDEDSLPVDDVRRIAVRVRNRIRVLLVEGGTQIVEDEILRHSFLVRNVLDPTHGEGADELLVFEPTVVDEDRFRSDTSYLADQDIIALFNVTSPSPETAKRLIAFVQKGGGLLIVPGPDTQPDAFNSRLFGLAGATGPLPLRLLEPGGFATDTATRQAFPDQYATPKIEESDHPILADFRQNENLGIALEATPVYRWWRVGLEDKPADTEILLSLANTDENNVLLAVRKFGRGRAVLLTSGLTPERPDRWNRLADAPFLYFPLIHSIAHYLAGEATRDLNRAVGEPLSTWLDRRPSALYLHRPGSQGRIPLAIGDGRRVKPKPETGGQTGQDKKAGATGPASPTPAAEVVPGWYTTPYAGAMQAGIYRLEVEFPERTVAARQILFAVNPDPREGELTYFSASRLKREFPGAEVQTALSLDESIVIGGSSEIGRLLLLAALLVAIGESVLASMLGGRRRR